MHSVRLSPEMQQRLDGLTRVAARRTWFGMADRDVVALLVEMAATPEPGALPCMLPYVVSCSPAVRRAAADFVRAAFMTVPLCGWTVLDETLRRMVYRSPSSKAAQSLTLADVPGRVETDTDLWCAGYLSCAPSGFVRAAALTALAARNDCLSLRFVALRLNDWVPQVRDIAIGATREALRAASAEPIVDILPLILRLQACGRSSFDPFAEPLTDRFADAAFARAVFAALGRQSPREQRLLFDFVGRMDASTSLSHLRELARIREPSIRARALDAILSRVPQAEVGALLEQMAVDRYMPVRKRAILHAIDCQHPGLLNVLERGLLDRSVAIRSLCAFHLRRMSFDLAAYYRAALDRERGGRLANGILGLGEFGIASDRHLLEPFLSQAAPLRCAAFEALTRLDAPFARPLLLAALGDAERAVTYAAARLLVAIRAEPDEAVIRLLRDARPHVRTAALRVAAGWSFWWRMPLLLDATLDDDAEVRRCAIANLPRVKRVWTEPAAVQRAALQASWNRASPALPDEVRRVIAGLLPR